MTGSSRRRAAGAAGRRLYGWRVEGQHSGVERGRDAALAALVKAMRAADARGVLYPLRVTAAGEHIADPAVMRLWYCRHTGALLSDWD